MKLQTGRFSWREKSSLGFKLLEPLFAVASLDRTRACAGKGLGDICLHFLLRMFPGKKRGQLRENL